MLGFVVWKLSNRNSNLIERFNPSFLVCQKKKSLLIEKRIFRMSDLGKRVQARAVKFLTLNINKRLLDRN